MCGVEVEERGGTRVKLGNGKGFAMGGVKGNEGGWGWVYTRCASLIDEYGWLL